MALSDVLHSLFVLLTVLTYALPIYEGIVRKSPFYISLFVTLGVLSFCLHCEETGLCDPLTNHWFKRLQTLDLGLSYLLLNVMLHVVLMIKNETASRVSSFFIACGIMYRDPFDLRRNLLVSGIVAILLLIFDVIQYRRTFFTSALWWRRIALIAAMAAVGALLFRLLKIMWAWHGIWHVYYVVSCYLLLLAQRENLRRTAEKLKGSASGSSGMGSHSSSGGKWGGLALSNGAGNGSSSNSNTASAAAAAAAAGFSSHSHSRSVHDDDADNHPASSTTSTASSSSSHSASTPMKRGGGGGSSATASYMTNSHTDKPSPMV
jgi:hypothetical protein